MEKDKQYIEESESEKKAHSIYQTYLKPRTMDLAGALRAGMIPKEELVDGSYYAGHCRNARIAMWHSPDQRFYYLRRKFNSTFADSIEHPQDDKGFDVFVPVARVLL